MNLTKYTQMAADRGLHIHMDKPGSIELFDLAKMIDTVKENRCVLSIGYMYRYNSEVMELYRKIEARELHPIERYLPGMKELVADVYECFETAPFTVAPKHRISNPQDRYDHMMEAFAAMARGEMTNPYTPDYELALYRVILRACGA